MADVPIFAYEDAAERVGQDLDLLRELIQIFFQEFEKSILELQRALSEQDVRVFTPIAHSLKGAAANVGAMQVAKVAGELEALHVKEQLAAAPILLQKLTCAVDSFRACQNSRLSQRTEET